MEGEASTSELQSGNTLGGYQLLVPVGEGGMGKVWAARHVDAPQGQLVALKTTLREVSRDTQVGQMLLDEARIAANILHPNVCTIREVGTDRGISYVVMDWMDAGNLLDLLLTCAERRMDPFLAAAIIERVAAGLHAAHELTHEDGELLNVVHRDVSPQNILLSSHGEVKVADFGIAKAKGQLHAPTVTGEVRGKLSYMSPEQLTTKDYDRRADIFALGCCLYELTTGKRPFHGEDAIKTMYLLLETDCKSPSEIVENYPSALESIVLRALMKVPAERYQTAEDMRLALASFLVQAGRRTSEREIGQFVRASLAGTLSQKAHAIAEATKTVVHRQTLGPRSGFEVTESEVGHPSHTLRSWNTDPPPVAPRISTHWLAVGLIGLVAAGFWMFHRVATNRAFGHTTVRTQASSTSSAPAPTAGKRVTVTLRTDPPDAILLIDGGPALHSPQVVVTQSSPLTHRIVVRREGYATSERVLSFERDQEVILGLKRAPDSLEASAAEVPSAARRPPQATKSAGLLQKSALNPLPSNPSVVKHPKRKLDSSNPFRDP